MEDEFADVVAREFGQTLRKVRLSVGLSQEELAHRAGRHRTLVSTFERGIRQPSLTTVFRFAHELGIEPSQLIAMMGKLKPPT